MAIWTPGVDCDYPNHHPGDCRCDECEGARDYAADLKYDDVIEPEERDYYDLEFSDD